MSLLSFIERLLALFLLIVISPVLILIALLVFLFLDRRAFFIQERVGLNSKIFSIVKFKTMKDTKDQEGTLLPDEQRLTNFGIFLRKSSLDELPELWNIIIGDMSFVGPRPLLVRYLPRYNEFQARRHEVRPGVTGWAQINGRNNLAWDEKFKLDVWYVDNHNLWLDLKIIFKTISKVVSRSGISQEGSATMLEFMGDKDN